MERRQKQVIDSYERVRGFVAAHPLEGGADYGVPKQLLDEIMERLASHDMMQERGTRKGRAAVVSQRLLARRLRDVHLKPIAQVGRAVLRDVPELHALLRPPRADVPASRMITQAMVVRELAAAHEQVLAANGCEVGFLAALDAAIGALQEVLALRADTYGARVGSRQGIIEEIRRGRDAVRMIDAVVRRRFADQPHVIEEWRVASRVRGVQGGGAGGIEPLAEGGADPLNAAA